VPNPKSPSQDRATEVDQPAGKPEPSSGPQHGRIDARRDKSLLKKNQERLGVGADHLAPTMKKHRRGTFP